MAEITIEPMRHAHIPAIMEIEREAFTTPWTAEMFRQEVEDNRLSRSYVAMAGDRLVGYLVAWFLNNEVHLLNVAVAASDQRRGTGRRMLQFLLDTAASEKKEIITLEVRESNRVAIELYRSFGFSRIGVRSQYYQDDKEDAVLMARYLPLSPEGDGE